MEVLKDKLKIFLEGRACLLLRWDREPHFKQLQIIQRNVGEGGGGAQPRRFFVENCVGTELQALVKDKQKSWLEH